MKKNVIISIKSKQTVEGKEADGIELVTEGSMTSRSTGGYLLSYQETEMTGLEGTRTTFRVEPKKVSLIRTGPVCSQMVFEVGRKHTSLYQTPFGNMEVGISTKNINIGLNDQGGSLEVDYAVEIDHALAGHNHFSIQVKEAARS